MLIAQPPATLAFDRTFGNTDRQRVALIEITLARGLTVDQKRQLHRAIADNLTQIGVRGDDVFVVLWENDIADWSEANGALTLVDQ